MLFCFGGLCLGSLHMSLLCWCGLLLFQIYIHSLHINFFLKIYCSFFTVFTKFAKRQKIHTSFYHLYVCSQSPILFFLLYYFSQKAQVFYHASQIYEKLLRLPNVPRSIWRIRGETIANIFKRFFFKKSSNLGIGTETPANFFERCIVNFSKNRGNVRWESRISCVNVRWKGIVGSSRGKKRHLKALVSLKMLFCKDAVSAKNRFCIKVWY